VKILKGAMIALLVAFVAIQFIRPEGNVQKRTTGTGLNNLLPIPDSVHDILVISCFDCHSDSTRYPWYYYTQPAAFFLSGHIEHGRKNLNFDEYALYRPFRQYGKLVQIERQLTEGEMPLPSYLLIHRDAVLSESQKNLLIAWSRALRDSLKARYPIDSLERKRPREGRDEKGDGTRMEHGG